MIGTISSLRGPSYPIPYSLRIRSSASAYLSRTPSVAGNRKTWTWSGWIKRGTLGSTNTIFGTTPGQYLQHRAQFTSDDKLSVYFETSSGTIKTNWITNAVFRDTSAWYHVIICFDTTASAVSDMCKFYVNNVLQQITTSSLSVSYITQNTDCLINSTYSHYIGSALAYYSGYNFDGYLAEVHFVDGQALTPASFGNISSATGVWAPKKYTGTYGTNGFYLKFADNSAATAAAIGKDSSGNSNNWTPTNISMVAGATYDSMTDTPTPYGDAAYYSGWNPSYGLQFRSSANTALTKTLPTGDNNRKWTWSAWLKRSNTATHMLFSRAIIAGSSEEFIAFSSNKLVYSNGATGTDLTRTVDTFTDTSAWYHVVFVYDSAQSVASDRGKFYVNGVLKTSDANNIGSSVQSYINTAGGGHALGSNASIGTNRFDGVMADINFIDGQALTPAAFAETDSTGTWVPKTYTGTYGTNGFYLNFADRSAMTAATIGNDASSNSNNWQPNNMAISDAVDYGARTARGNYAVLNPLNAYGATITDGSLKIGTTNTTNDATNYSTSLITSGKWYAEFMLGGSSSTSTSVGVGVSIGSTIAAYNRVAQSTNGVMYLMSGNKEVQGAGSTAYGATYTYGDLIGIALDLDAVQPTVTFYKNNATQGSINLVSGSASTGYVMGATVRGGNVNFDANFGQRPFAYTPPTGFKALCTHNLPVPTIKKAAAYMAATTYTGTGVGRTITNTVNNTSFQPDLVWIKSRTPGATSHALFNSTRGTTKYLSSNTAGSETTNANTLTAFGADGFSLGTDTTLVNANANSYIAWQWKESVASGLDVVTYSGTLTTGGTVAINHNLGVAPSLVISKSLTPTGADTGNWFVWHASAGTGNFLRLNTPDQAGSISGSGGGTMIAPTSSVFYTPYISGANASGNNYVAYCFAEIAGYSKFGSYTGNSSTNGPFCFTGFRPRWILIKAIGTVADGPWCAYDSSRPGWNVDNAELGPNNALIESDNDTIDILSNGFKLRTAYQSKNLSGITYIYAAFAEVPSKYALAR